MKLTLRNTFARIWIAALVLLIVGLTALDSLVAGQETKRVFVLNSYHRGYPFSDNAMRGIDDAFGKSGIKAETYVTYMDMKRIPTTPQYFSKLKELIRVGYNGARFDAVIACDNDALEFMRKYRDELFPGVPVVFTGINDFDKRMLDGRSDITGISQSNDYAGTVRIAQKFRPATKDIVVVTDNTTTGMAHRSAIVKIRPDFPQSLGFTYLSLADMTLDELAEKLSKLNSDSIVLLLHHFVDRNGTGHSIQESTSLLAKSSSVPIFVVSDIRMGFGTLGGHLVGGYSQGEAAAQIAVKIFGGTDVRTIPVLLESPNRFMFDYNVMKRFSIAEGDLPQGSIMINKPVSVLEEYKPQMFAILVTFIVLSGILVYMLLEIRRRKRAEDALQESEILFRSTFEQAAVGVAHVSLEGRFIRVNQRFCDIVGYSKEEMLPLTFQDITYPEDLDMDLNYVRQVLEGLIDTYSMEKRYIRKDGYLAWVNLTVSLLRAATGKPMHFISVVEDITERKQTEEALRKSEELLRLITDNMSDMIRVTDLKGDNLFTSPSHFKSLGYRPEEWVGKSAFDIIHPDDLENVIKAFSEGLAANRPVSLEYRVRHADGHYVWLETVGDLLRDAQGNVTAVVMSSRDISQRKATAEELGRSEEKYRTLIETTRTGFVILDQDGLVLDANPEYVRLTGHHNLSEIVGKSVIEWTADHEKEKNAAAVGECFRKGYIRNLEIDYVDSKGNITPIEINATRMECGRVTQILTLCRDITERQEAEEELLIKDRAIASSFNAIAISNLDGKLTYVNDAFLNIWGYSAQEALNINAADLASSKYEINHIINDIQEKGFSLGESIAIRKNGSLFNIQFSASLITSSENKPIAMLSTFLDITDRMRAEEALKESEDRFSRAIAGTGAGLWDWDIVNDRVYFSPQWKTMLGYEDHEVEDAFSGWKNLWHPEDAASIEKAVNDYLHGRTSVYDVEHRLRHKDGSWHWILTRGDIHRDSAGRPVRWVGTNIDITERKRAEEARFDALARFSGFADASQYGMGMADLDGRITFANATLARMLGEKTAENCLGKHFPTAYYSPSIAQKLQKEVLPALMSVGYWHGELEIQTVDGRNVPTEENYFVIRDEQGQIRNLADILTDISERKRAEEEREKLQAQLARAQKLESIGTLAGGIAHDFNNLLMGIQGHASLMMLGLDPSDPRHVRLKHIEELIQSGADLTGQLLGFARGGRYDVKPVSMNDIVEKSSAMFGRTKKEINIHRKFVKDPCIVEADRSQMEQVFMNLFVNAWQAMPGGGDMFVETEKVVLDETHAMSGRMAPGRYVKVTVTDTGTGMDAQTKERIFDPFFTTKGMGRGTGLGLATVYGIMRGHGGMITAESEPGQGTTFTLYVPASENDPDEEKKPAKGVLRGTETILLVDDEKMVLEVSRELLESLGYRVYAAGSGQEAVAVYMEKRNKIDLVILDMVMPGISGGETFDRLREIHPGIRVLLSSGYSINGEAQTIMDRGCSGFLQKPFQMENLSRKVREILD
jgi:PAS domain S-box-containing protein